MSLLINLIPRFGHLLLGVQSCLIALFTHSCNHYVQIKSQSPNSRVRTKMKLDNSWVTVT
jgi:hypothetical protein